MFKCKFCGKEFEKSTSLAAHVSHCKENLNKKRTKESYKKASIQGLVVYKENRKKYKELHPEKYVIHEYRCNCEKCGKEYIVNISKEQFEKGNYKKNCSRSCANGHKVSKETKQKISIGIKKFNDGNIRNTSKNIAQYSCKVCGKTFTKKDIRDVSGCLYCSAECKHKYLSEHTGGYRRGAGHGKSGWYKGIYCDSTWELAFVIYHLDHDLKIERCKEPRKYIFNNKEHLYFPDFITDRGIIEIKGYSTSQWEAKQSQNPDIIVLFKKDMQMYIDYVKEQYGNSFDYLYDGNNPKNVPLDKLWKLWVHNNSEELFIDPNEYDNYISKGYKRGRLKIKK